MTPDPVFRIKTGSLVTCGALCIQFSAQAADIYKANNANNLNLGTSWELGTAPTATDVANWDAAVTTANTTLLGADLSWEGLRVTTPGGAVSISGPNTLSLGNIGIDLFGATQDLTVNSAIALTADQFWSSASGRTITATGAISGAFNLTKAGPGALVMSGSSSNTFGSLSIDTAGGIPSASTLFFNKTGGAVAVPANTTVKFGLTTTGQANLRMLQPNQFGAGVVMEFGNASGNWARVDLNGTNQTLAGIKAGALATLGGAVIQNRLVGDSASQLGPVTLTLNGSDSYLYNGYLRDVDGGAVGNNQLTLVKNGSGTQTLAGTAISYTGGTIVNDGKILLGGGAASGTIRGALTVNSPATLDFLGSNSFGYNPGVNVNSLTINNTTVGGGDFNNHFYQSFQLNMTGGTLLLGGTATAGNAVNNEFQNATITANSSPVTSTIGIVPGNTTALMRIRDGQPMTFNVADGPQGIDLLVTAPLVTVTSGSIATKTGAGTLSLSGDRDNSSTVLAATGGTTILDKSGAAIRAVAGISNIGAGATVRIAGTSGDQIYGLGAGTIGRVFMSGGTLDLAGLSEGWDRLDGTGLVTNSVAAPSVLTLGENNGSSLFTGSINDGAGTLKLVKAGTGTLGLSGTSTLSGTVEVNAGTLALSGSLPASATIVADGAGVAGEGSFSSLTLGASAGGALLADPSTAGALTVTGALEVKGTAAVSLASGSFTSGTPFKVIGFGSKAGVWGAANFALANAASYRGTPVFNETASEVTLTLTGADLVWNNAAADLKWNTQLSANFKNGAANDTFSWADKVTFDNTPGADQAIVIDGIQQPAAMTVDSQFNYTFTSGTAGSLGGGMSLVKSGTGTLTLGTANSFLGSTTVNGGTLVITSDASLGTPPIVPTPGHLALNGSTLRWNANFNLNGNRGIALGAGGATFNSTAAGNGNTVNVSSAIAGNGGLTLQANGDTSDTGGGVGGSTQLTSAGNSFTGPVAITSGVVTANSNFGDPANTILLNGGGLVDQNTNTNLSRNIQIGAAGGVYRAYGSVATGTLSGSISNAPGVASAILRRTDGGTVWLAGDGSGFTGQYQNKRGNTRISAPSANWANTDFVQDTAGGYLEFRGGGTATINSSASTRDVFANFGTTLNVDSGAITMATNGHWWQTNSGDQGKLTSSSGVLTVTNGAASGTLGTLDHQIRLVLQDFNGATPLTFVKNGVNLLQLDRANTHSGGTIINAGRVHAVNVQAFGSGPVTVNNGGQVYLTGTGTFANHFTIEGPGQLEGAGTLGAIRFEPGRVVSGNITVAATGARITGHAGATGTVTGALLGGGNLEINSSAANNNGTINLNGNSPAYTGTVTVSQGRLNLNAASFGGSVVSPDNTTLGGEATVAGTLSLGSAAGSTLAVDLGTPGMLSTTGAMAVTGTINVNASGAVSAGGAPMKVVGFGSKSGVWNEANFALVGIANYRPGAAFAEVANTIELTVPSKDLVWNNSVANSTWDTNVSANFEDNVPSNQPFFWGDRVTFKDLGDAAQTITVTGTVQPSAMTVNSQYDYTFNGGTIGGGSLVKDGSGILTLTQANTFNGGTTVAKGTLRTTNTASLGTGTVTLGSAASGSSDVAWLINGGNAPANPLVVSALATGTVTIGSATAGTFTAPTGPLTLNRPVIMQDGSNDRTTYAGKISGTVGTITLTGARITFASPANDFAGDLIVSAGTIYQNDAAGALPDSTDITLTGTTSRFRLNSNSETIGALTGSGIVDNVTGSGNTLTLGGGNASGTFSGTFTNGSGVLNVGKTGTGSQTLEGASTHSGTTTVDSGTLFANNTTGSATGTGAVVVNGTGILGGTGAVAGAVTVNTGGVLAPGTAIESLATGALNLASGSSLAVEYNSSGVPAADTVNVTGNVTLAGSLNLSDLAAVPAPVALGTKLTILTYTGTLTGTFAGLPEGTTVASGPNLFKVRYADGNAVTLESTDTVVGDAYGTWASGKGLTGSNDDPALDPDKDGFSNLLEFYLDGNPLASDGSIAPVVTTDATYLKLTFKRRDDAEAHVATELVQWGTSLATWADVALGAANSGPDANGVLVTVAENGGSPDDITVSIPRALAAGGKLFARLKVTE